MIAGLLRLVTMGMVYFVLGGARGREDTYRERELCNVLWLTLEAVINIVIIFSLHVLFLSLLFCLMFTTVL